MARKPGLKKAETWQEKLHEIEFSNPELETLKKLYASHSDNPSDLLAEIIVDNASIKLRSSEHYGSYTISYTLDKDHPKYPGHSWWFWDDDLLRGLTVMGIFVRTMLPDWLETGRTTKRSGLW